MKTATLSSQLYKSRIDISESTRGKSIAVLNQLVATCLDLYSQVKQAHWNVKGKDFYQLHLLFDDVAATVFDPIDLLAERVTALGGVALGTVRDSATFTLLPIYPSTEEMNETDHLNAVADRLAIFARALREGMDRTDSWNDQSTNDILTQVSREVDKKLWFVEAHLQRKL